jgi:electron transport complex protein RnfG
VQVRSAGLSDQEENSAALEGTSSRVAVMMVSVMVGIAAVCGLLIVFTYEATLPTIKRKQAEYLQSSIFEVLPAAKSVRKFHVVPGESTSSGTRLALLEGDESGNEIMVYATYDENSKLNGVALAAAGQGYTDTIRILYGFDPNRSAIVGMKVLETKETPGIGDKIELDPAFRANFVALDVSLNDEATGLANEIITVKNGARQNPWEIDGITGATISSKAIGKMLNQSANLRLPVVVRNLETMKETPPGQNVNQTSDVSGGGD